MTFEKWYAMRPTRTPHRLPMTERDQHRATWQAATKAERELCEWIALEHNAPELIEAARIIAAAIRDLDDD